FFQAEDGIRDFHVTGVQTCALPISRTATMVHNTAVITSAATCIARTGSRLMRITISCHIARYTLVAMETVRTGSFIRRIGARVRSEERRVVKECRCSTTHED